MRKGCKALLCLAAAVLGLFLVRLAVEKTEPSYPEALGNTLDVEKITGTCLVKEAAELPDTLTIFGSSELKTFEIPTHPANFFAGKRAGFQVNLVGAAHASRWSTRWQSARQKTASRERKSF